MTVEKLIAKMNDTLDLLRADTKSLRSLTNKEVRELTQRVGRLELFKLAYTKKGVSRAGPELTQSERLNVLERLVESQQKLIDVLVRAVNNT